MVHTLGSLEEFISTLEPFNQLPPQAIKELGETLQPLRCRMGQVILMRDKIPPYIAIIYEGQVRSIGYDARTGVPVSIELLTDGHVLGWVSLIRELPCETAIASTEVTALTLEREKFFELLQKYPPLEDAFRQKPALIEVFELLGAQLTQRATGEGDLKEMAHEAIEQASVHYLAPGIVNELPPLPPGQMWALSSGQLGELSVGSTVELKGRGPLEVSKSSRLISLLLPEAEEVEKVVVLPKVVKEKITLWLSDFLHSNPKERLDKFLLS